jgi:hypothetical protein
MSSSIASLVVLFAFLAFRAGIERCLQLQSLRVRLYAFPYQFARMMLLSLLVLVAVTVLGFDARPSLAFPLHKTRIGAGGRHLARLYFFSSAEDAGEGLVGSRGVASIGVGVSVHATVLRATCVNRHRQQSDAERDVVETITKSKMDAVLGPCPARSGTSTLLTTAVS